MSGELANRVYYLVVSVHLFVGLQCCDKLRIAVARERILVVTAERGLAGSSRLDLQIAPMACNWMASSIRAKELGELLLKDVNPFVELGMNKVLQDLVRCILT